MACLDSGEVAEWLKAPHSKVGRLSRVECRLVLVGLDFSTIVDVACPSNSTHYIRSHDLWAELWSETPVSFSRLRYAVAIQFTPRI